MNNPLGVGPSKGIREPHEVKKKSFDLGGNRTRDLRIRSTVTLPTELRSRTEKVWDDLGGESRRRESKGIREPHEVKKKSFDLGGNRTRDLRIRSTVTLPTELRSRTEKVWDDLGGESRRRESKGTYECCAA